MFFSISKAYFLCHKFLLYIRHCSPLMCILFVIISLAKLIVFLNLSFCSVNYYSILFTRVGISLQSPILWRADAKLIKQQLLYCFWWYFSTGYSGWNLILNVIFALRIGTTNNGYIFVSWLLILVWYFFNRNTVHMSWIFLLTTHDQDRTNFLILLIVLGSYIYWSCLFIFYHLTPFGGS